MRASRYRHAGKGDFAALTLAVAPAMAQGNAEAVRLYGGDYAASPLADREFKRAYARALGPLGRVSWLATMEGPNRGENHRRTLLGQPPPAVAAALDRLSRDEWRQPGR